MSAGRQIRQTSKQTIKNEQCGSIPPKGVPQANSHNTWALVRQRGYLWPIANWEQRHATRRAAAAELKPAFAAKPKVMAATTSDGLGLPDDLPEEDAGIEREPSDTARGSADAAEATVAARVRRNLLPCVGEISDGEVWARTVVPQSRGLPRKEGSNGRLSRSRDTRYGTRGPGSRADRNTKTSRHGLLAGDDGASHRRRASS